jgi:hypothetical protein
MFCGNDKTLPGKNKHDEKKVTNLFMKKFFPFFTLKIELSTPRKGITVYLTFLYLLKRPFDLIIQRVKK